jgi:hypothetical protein
MDKRIFSKMKVKPGYKGFVINQPDDYPAVDFITLSYPKGEKYEFVHLFVKNKNNFDKEFQRAFSSYKGDGLFWISYPKGASKIKTDINRDSLWDLSIPLGVHPVAQVSLDETWSAVRMKLNEEGVAYARPNSK